LLIRADKITRVDSGGAESGVKSAANRGGEDEERSVRSDIRMRATSGSSSAWRMRWMRWPSRRRELNAGGDAVCGPACFGFQPSTIQNGGPQLGLFIFLIFY
jgi:hypothetical protein